MPSSAPEPIDSLLVVASALAGTPVRDIATVCRGANSRVFRAVCADGVYALKLYPPRMADPRDRLGAESSALTFFAKTGLIHVPRLRAVHRGYNAALLEWIEGDPVDAPTEKDTDAALGFLGELHRWRTAPGTRALLLASEACFSAKEVEAQVRRRLDRLADVATNHADLQAMLSRIEALVRDASRSGRELYGKAGLNWDADIDPDARTLSPSDFGFHNTVRRADGSLAFLDFEYFGWDDPAKLVCDVLLHPGMSMPEPLKLRFLAGARAIYGADSDFAMRMRALYPLFGARWCAILLNEFLPERWMVRAHAGGSDAAAAQVRQMEKLLALLQKLSDKNDPVAHALHV